MSSRKTEFELIAQLCIGHLEKSTYRAGASSDNTIERQGVWYASYNTKAP